jgi:hypothetical protein
MLHVNGNTAAIMGGLWNATDIWNGVLANLVTLALTALVALFLYLVLGRRALLRFFGVDRRRNLRIYVGHVAHPNVPKGYVGFEEVSEAKNLEALFKSVIPGLSDQSGVLRFLQIADIQTEILPGAQNDPGVKIDQSTIALGSSRSNYASQLIEKELKCPVWVDNYTAQLHIPNLSPITSLQQGVAVRLCRDTNHYFYVFGGDEPTTAGCTRFLTQNWRAMQRKYGDDKSFYYLLEVKNDNRKTVISIADHELQII